MIMTFFVHAFAVGHFFTFVCCGEFFPPMIATVKAKPRGSHFERASARERERERSFIEIKEVT
jgi:hypothetical protein